VPAWRHRNHEFYLCLPSAYLPSLLCLEPAALHTLPTATPTYTPLLPTGATRGVACLWYHLRAAAAAGETHASCAAYAAEGFILTRIGRLFLHVHPVIWWDPSPICCSRLVAGLGSGLAAAYTLHLPLCLLYLPLPATGVRWGHGRLRLRTAGATGHLSFAQPYMAHAGVHTSYVV